MDSRFVHTEKLLLPLLLLLHQLSLLRHICSRRKTVSNCTLASENENENAQAAYLHNASAFAPGRKEGGRTH